MKILSWNVHNDVTEAKKKHLDELKKEINQLYVSCTRARDVLYIIQPERETLYMKMLRRAFEEE